MRIFNLLLLSHFTDIISKLFNNNIQEKKSSDKNTKVFPTFDGKFYALIYKTLNGNDYIED